MGAYTGTWMQAAAGAASGALGIGIQRLGTNWDQRQQRQQQEALMGIQMKGERALMDYQQMKQLEMWEKTGYGAQVDQMKRAGINPALMYGMGGGGAQTIGGGMPSTTGANAPYINTTSEGMGLNLIGNTQLALLKAQKENIEADTKDKLANLPIKDQQQYGMGLDNALKLYLQSTDEEGEDADYKDSITGKKAAQEYKKLKAETDFRLDENDRQNLMNDKRMQQIGADITLMAKRGLELDEITNNLKKEGKLKDAEIAWNELGMKRGDLGHFIMELIKAALKGK